ncbi:hypothetical protein PCV68_001068 [Staphylococcus pseudintermedius]|nr:hypothetical protein [Staphylococcus pseudintermedius]
MVNFLHMLNILVVAIFMIGYLPQVYTTIKCKQHKGVSTSFWYYVAVSTSITLHNMIVTGEAEWYMYMGQIVNALFAVIFFVYFNHMRNKHYKARYIAFVAAYLLVTPMATNLLDVSHSQIVASVAIVAAYVSQLKHFYINKTSEGTNPLLYGLFATGILVLILVLLLTGASTHVIITESINVGLLLVCYVAAVIYKK